jgi:hypothetical protein
MKRIISILTMTLALALSVSAAFAGPGRWNFNQGNTFGWQLMTPAERTEHQAKMWSFKEYNACREYLDQHRATMMERAKEKGVNPPIMRRNPCDMMKTRGFLK